MTGCRLAVVFATATALAALATGCSTGGDTPAPGTAAHTTAPQVQPTAGTPAPSSGNTLGVSGEQVTQLCSDIDGQLQSWRTYTPTIGKAGLNTAVVSWATANGVDLLKLAGDRGQVDTIMSEQCPQVHDGALYALEVPTLASALIGF
ncbi:hypothetical protein [Prescottella subtropica]|uniref:hypothetical protein n=1 Tax=Prescottella subtropica TaxID=2545757 RepID=UPI0010F4BFA7|nr:hypothetical protein [Prescottella subtropica]